MREVTQGVHYLYMRNTSCTEKSSIDRNKGSIQKKNIMRKDTSRVVISSLRTNTRKWFTFAPLNPLPMVGGSEHVQSVSAILTVYIRGLQKILTSAPYDIRVTLPLHQDLVTFISQQQHCSRGCHGLNSGINNT